MTRTIQEYREVARQQELDAALPLLNARQAMLKCIDKRGRVSRDDVDLAAIGIDRIRKEMGRRSTDCREVLSVSPVASVESATAALGPDLWSLARGVRLKGLFNQDACDAGVPDILLSQPNAPYYFCLAPVLMKLVDRRAVFLEGPAISGERTALMVTAPEVVKTAWHYWANVAANAVPVSALATTNPAARLTQRQRGIVELMADDLSDDAIARRLEVSVRTVRSEVATIVRLVDARSRFGAGFRLGRLSLEHMNAPLPAQPACQEPPQTLSQHRRQAVPHAPRDEDLR